MPMQVVQSLPPPVKRDQLLRLPAVITLVGLRKSALYAMMRAGEFPKPVRIGGRSVAWSADAVYGWVQARLTTPQTEGGAK